MPTSNKTYSEKGSKNTILKFVNELKKLERGKSKKFLKFNEDKRFSKVKGV
jgi:hypothetical protein